MMKNLVGDFLDRLRREGMQIDESPKESLGKLANLYRVKSSNGSIVVYIKKSTAEGRILGGVA